MLQLEKIWKQSGDMDNVFSSTLYISYKTNGATLS